MKCAYLERIVERNGDRMGRRRFVEEPDMASLLANHGIARAVPKRESAGRPIPRAAALCSLKRNQFILYKMQLDEL